MSRTDGPFHVVKHTWEDSELITYSIYLNNRLYLKPARNKKLGRAAAYEICAVLNRSPWPEPKATREELLAVR